jgi:hypothetical protein
VILSLFDLCYECNSSINVRQAILRHRTLVLKSKQPYCAIVRNFRVSFFNCHVRSFVGSISAVLCLSCHLCTSFYLYHVICHSCNLCHVIRNSFHLHYLCHLCHMFSDLDRIAKREPWTKRMKLTWQLHVTWGIGLGSYSCCLGHAAGQCSVPNYMASFFSKLCFPLNLKPRMTILTPKLLNLKTHQHNAIFSHGIY